MRVDVESWQQACCGEPFAVGEQVTWEVRALPGADGVTYLEDHHAEDEVPVEVTGVVRGILRIDQAFAPVPGQRSSHVPVGEPELVPVDAVGGPGGIAIDADGWRVELDPEPGSVLPTVHPDDAAWAARAGADDDAWKDAERARASGEIGAALRALADRTAAELGDRLGVRRSPSGTGFTLTPRAPDAVDVLWTLGPRTIDVVVGEGRWRLPASPAGVERLAGIIAAARAGRVEHRMRDRRTPEVELIGTAERIFRWRVHSFGGDGFLVAPARDMDAIQRGTVRAAPWDGNSVEA